MSITVVGLGASRGDLTLNGLEALKSAEIVILRTEKTAASKTLKEKGISYIALDNLYHQYSDFEALYTALAELAQHKSAVYCVDGGGTDDASVNILIEKYGASVVPGVSRESAALALSKCDGNIFCSVSAASFVTDNSFYAPKGTFVIKEIDNCYIASDVKLKILELYSDIDLFYMVGGQASAIKASDIDRQKRYDYSSAIVVPAMFYTDKARFSFEDLIAIVYRLRAKDGCQWDRAQTHETIRINCIEEAYELVEAIDLNDIDKMLEETGDVLLQGVFHAVIAEDASEYTMTDVLTVLCRKLLDRHTHIFGSVKASSPEEALAAWEAAKAKEKKQQSYTERMEQVAQNLPALIKAEKIQKIAKKANFDWPDAAGALEKLFEEIEELKSADDKSKEEEGGDLLFAAVNVLRHYGVEPEIALAVAVKS
jgi:tetrapyrrole methylase family protein/MazG family protein